MTLKEFWNSDQELYVRFETRKQLQKFFKESDRLGKTWANKDSFIDSACTSRWLNARYYKNECICNNGGYISLEVLKTYDPQIFKENIITFDDIIFEDSDESSHKDHQYIDFLVAPYALGDTLLALYNSNVKEFAVTKEDNDLHIRIDVEYLEKIVYKLTKVTADNECCKNKEDK